MDADNGVAVFHDQDEAYAGWMAAHPHGYVLNLRAQGVPTLHRVGCHSLRTSGAARSGTPTSVPKVCATDRAAIEAWARAEGRRFLSCAECNA